MSLNKKFIFLAIFLQVTLFISEINGEVFEERDFGEYHPPEYLGHSYPPNYHLVNDEPFYPETPVQGLMRKGMNFLMVKLGILGLIKGVMIFLFALFVIKLPLLILKALLIKSLFIPVIAGPVLLYYYISNMNQPDTSTKPTTQTPAITTTILPALATGSRSLNEDNPMSLTWESIKMFAENDQCLERVYCVLGASNDNSYLGTVFLRALKFLNSTPSPGTEKRMSSLMKAYNRGKRTLKCPQSDYKCPAPEITIQQGSKKIKVF